MYCRDCKHIIKENEHITNKCPGCGSIYLIPEESREEINKRKQILKSQDNSFGARIAASFAMLIASFITACVIWLIAFYFIGKSGNIFIFSVEFIGYVTAVFTVMAFIFPNKTLDLIGWVWQKLDNLIKSMNNYSGPM